jgi:signal transduction histidine kinase
MCPFGQVFLTRSLLDRFLKGKGEMGHKPPRSASSAQQNQMSFQQLEAYVASFPDAILVWDRAGKIRFLNAAAQTLFEIQASDAWLGTSAQQFLQHYAWCDEQHRPFSFAPWLLDLTTTKEKPASFPDEQSLVLALPSRHRVLLELRCALVRDGQQQPIGVLAAFHPVAPRYQKALHIQQVHEALMTLKRAITQIPEQFQGEHAEDAFLLSPPVLFINQQLVDVIRQILACWCVSLVAFRPPTPHIAYVVGSGFTSEREHHFRAESWRYRFTDFFDEPAFARLQANQEVIFTPDCVRIPEGFPEELGTANMLTLPLFWKQHLAGMLVIYKHQWEGEYTREEIDLVRAVTAHVLLLVDCLSSLHTYLSAQARELILPEVDRLSNDFLRLSSHELRTPLTVTKGNLQVAQRRLERLKSELAQQAERTSAYLERTQQSLESAEQSVRLQERMVQDMIDDACLQAGQLELVLTSCDLLLLVKQAVAKQQKSAPGRAIELQILTFEATIPVLADAGRIIQVLSVYLAAALASSPAEQPVTVQVREEEQMARVSVHDEGPGIPLEEQVRLWERFYRGEGSSRQQERDLSLGLRFYLCRALLERHHGTVGVQSTPEQGTTFWLTLPIARSAGA